MSQAEIGDAIGVSQMHVSRLLRRSFEQMRDWIDDPGRDESGDAHGASSESTARE
jgi:DNA-directed RNA polymerase specialized sigma24 family protein